MDTEAVMKNVGRVLVLVLASLQLHGCMQVALRASPALFPNVAATIFEECDPELAKASIPSNLKLMEGLLKNDPENKNLLIALSMGFSGYSLLFVEPDDPERAALLHLRAFEYGIRALGPKGVSLRNREGPLEALRSALSSMDEGNIQALFWAALSWSAWINLNLDKPSAFAQFSASEACVKRILELDDRFFFGAPHILMGASLAARPPLLGGNPEKARFHFEHAMKQNEGKFFLAPVYFAKYYAVRVQDRALFTRIIQKVLQGDPQDLKGACLINRVMQTRAAELAKQAQDLFL